MLRTCPEAEFPVRLELSPDGERVWHWVTLGMQIPYFLTEYQINTENGPFVRQVIFSDLELVKSLQQAEDGAVQLRSVSLLSPGYLNGSDGYEMERLDEVRSMPDDPGDFLFVLKSGRTLRFNLTGSEGRAEEMILLLDLRPI